MIDDYPVKLQDCQIEEDSDGHPVAWLLIEKHEPLAEGEPGLYVQNLVMCREGAIGSIDYDLRSWYKVRGLTPSQLHKARNCVNSFSVSIKAPTTGKRITWQIVRLNVWPVGVKQRLGSLEAEQAKHERSECSGQG